MTVEYVRFNITACYFLVKGKVGSFTQSMSGMVDQIVKGLLIKWFWKFSYFAM